MRRRDAFLLGFALGAALVAWWWDEAFRELRDDYKVYEWVPNCPTCGHSMAMHDKQGGCHVTIYTERGEGTDARPCSCPQVTR